MNKKTLLTISKSVIIIVLLLAVVFALRAPAADLNLLPSDIKGDYVDSSGLPYFSEMDSYYNLRLTENYVDHGYAGDSFANGTEMDMHRVAPDGLEFNYERGIIYITSFFYDVANMFGSYSVKEVAFWTGAIVSCFAVIPAYIFTRRLTTTKGAIAATLIIALAPNYFAHTFPGFFDTDMFYYIFSLFFIFFFVESLRSKNLVLKIIFAILSVISIGLFSLSWTGYIFYVALMGLYVVIYLILSYVFNIGKDDADNYKNKLDWFIHQRDFLSVILITVIAFIGLAMFKGFDGVTGIFGQVLNLLSLQSSLRVVGGFPNVLVSVAELQLPTLLGAGMGSAFLANSNGVVNGIGGISVLFAGLITLYTLVLRAWKLRSAKVKSNIIKKPPKSERKASSKKIDDKHKVISSFKDIGSFGSSDEIYKTKHLNLIYTTLFIVWVVVSALAVSKGSRFITTLVLPFAILTGIFVGYSEDYIKNKLKSDKWLMAIIVLCALLASYPLIQISTFYGFILLAVIVILGAFLIYGLKNNDISFKNVPLKKYLAIFAIVLALVSPTVCGAYQTANNVVPGTSDPMWDSMVWINENTPDNTVITSWWDFGYLFEIAADRQVTFDGGSQSGERAFWLGQAMSTDNLELSAGIFRMLDTTGDKAVEALNNITHDTGKTTSILLEILPLTKEDAKNVLVNNYSLTGVQANNIVGYTHPDNPRPVIFVASSDMLQKAGWWSYFGAWNFNNQSSINYNYYVPSSQLSVEPGSTGRLSLLKDIGISFNVVVTRGNTNNSTTAYTEAVYPNGTQIKINGSDYNPLNASRLLVVENGYIVKNETIPGSGNSNYTIFLMGEGNVYTPILMSNKLENSMFTRLYLLGGANQDIFTMVHMENGVSLWKVNFNNTVAGGGSGTSTNTTK